MNCIKNYLDKINGRVRAMKNKNEETKTAVLLISVFLKLKI
jgi:hypothetical protein